MSLHGMYTDTDLDYYHTNIKEPMHIKLDKKRAPIGNWSFGALARALHSEYIPETGSRLNFEGLVTMAGLTGLESQQQAPLG